VGYVLRRLLENKPGCYEIINREKEYEILFQKGSQKYFIYYAGKLFEKIPTKISTEVFKGVEYKQHKTKLKCFVNPILRKIQFFTDRPWVIASQFLIIDSDYYLVGYSFERVLYHKC